MTATNHPLPLFDLPSRSTDPKPSKRQVTADRHRQMTQAFLDGLRFMGGRATANEAAAAGSEHGLRADDVRKRYCELLKQGEIVTDGEKRCAITGNVVTAYREFVT